jgi:uncharacterized protein (DUF952 family)
LIFKVVPRAEWERVADIYHGSAHDRADGFLHFSTGGQLAGTLQRHYAGQYDLMLVAADPARLGAALKWEYAASRNEHFPHLYAPLPRSAVLWAKPITRDAQGEFVIPA